MREDLKEHFGWLLVFLKGMPLILTSNEVIVSDDFDWEDVTGVQYHYPNGYRNLIRSGERFVYYRGVRRAGKKRGNAEYFGTGLIGDVWRDARIPQDVPKKDWQWFRAIDSYVPFRAPVAAKINGNFFEVLPSNGWRTAVRKISDETLGAILNAADVVTFSEERSSDLQADLPNLSEVELEAVANGLLLARSRGSRPTGSGSAAQPVRRSRFAKAIGDRAEELVVRHLNRGLGARVSVRHVAGEGDTPGWDIEYLSEAGELNAVEVKATTASMFLNFQLAAGELSAAKDLGEKYWVYLVSDCLTARPRLQVVNDPAGLLVQGLLRAEPLSWNITLQHNAGEVPLGCLSHNDYASLSIGHANIGTTARYYLGKKGRTTVGLGHLLTAASDSRVIQIPDTVPMIP
jgi:hypothetical protein